ncbi:FMN-binding protein [Acholeplasma equirhinis]|uniref:FMN-binding protein n=1 Tax=Acholeplasma equirhinis TaxID=555393 RepID=UPI00197AAC56|nr:FMN-binding protein [Acholeplasma equirhinis]MBN3490046.1 FMN-binding protein [Acholeplasma equirhinis]
MMKKYLSMLLFVVIMGTVSVGVLMGADLLTNELIAKNSEFVWKSAILDHHEIAHTQTDFVEIFDASFEVSTTPEDAEELLTLYTNNETGQMSFRFYGMGLWDTIEGVITFEPDWKTIVKITVTKQAETPGLGGRVAERKYLDNFVGKEFNEDLEIKIIKGVAVENYEVDAITGATGTSNAFGNLLTANYRKYIYAFSDVDPDAIWKKAMLSHNNVSFNNSTYISLFDETFDVLTKQDRTIYKNKTNGNVSFIFETGGLNGPITGILTLEDDFITIVNITVTSNSEVQGAVVAERPILDSLIGKKFNPTIEFVTNPTADNQGLDGFAAATTTKSKFTEGLNETQAEIYTLFFLDEEIEEPEVDPTMVWKQAMLSNNGIDSTNDNFATLFTSSFNVLTKGDLTVYIHKTNFSYNFLVEGQGAWGPIKSVLSLEQDFQTIKKVVVYEQTEKAGAKIQTDPSILEAFIGAKFNPTVSMVPEPSNDSEVIDGLTGVTSTRNGFLNSINETYAAYYQLFIEQPMKQAMLANNGIESTSENYQSLFDETFNIESEGGLTLYVHKTTGSVSFLFEGQGQFSIIKSVLTLESDFQTILKVAVYHQNEKGGAKIQTDPSVLAVFTGAKFNPSVTMVAEPSNDSEVLIDGLTGVTGTRNGFLDSMNAAYAEYFEAFGGNE